MFSQIQTQKPVWLSEAQDLEHLLDQCNMRIIIIYHVINFGTIDCIQSVWLGDYIPYNKDKLRYVITIVDNNYVKFWEANERRSDDFIMWEKIDYVLSHCWEFNLALIAVHIALFLLQKIKNNWLLQICQKKNT